MRPLMTVAGIDGCPGGWVVVTSSGMPPRMEWTPYIVRTFADAILVAAGASIISVDIPIGLSDQGHSNQNQSLMKALSVKQPWANLIASGEKTIETRKWSTDYRGDLLIVSSRSPRIEPAGYALAVARLVECRPMTRQDEREACCPLYPDAYAWVLTDIRAIKPFPVKGHLGVLRR